MVSCEWMLEIVHRAVLDWRQLIRAKAWKCKEWYPAQSGVTKIPGYRCNFTELRQFFKSDWCAVCLQLNNSSVNPVVLLERLEAELAEAILKDEGKSVKKEAKQKAKAPKDKDRKECKGCGYFRSGSGDQNGIMFCHHYLDTGIRRKVGEDGKCLSKAKDAKRLCKSFEAPIAQV